MEQGATARLGEGFVVQVLLYLMQTQVWVFSARARKQRPVLSMSSLREQSQAFVLPTASTPACTAFHVWEAAL